MPNFGKPRDNKLNLTNTGLTRETQSLLEDVMSKKGLSVRATNDIVESLARGSNAWVNTLTSGTASFHVPASKTATKVAVPKFRGPAGRLAPPTAPASFSGKRMLHQIPQPERDTCAPRGPGPDRDKLKDELSQVMEHGNATAARKFREQQQALAMQQQELQDRAYRQEHVDTKELLIDQLITEIKDRADFLESMRAVGKVKEYEYQIRSEIQQRMVRLSKLGVAVSDPTQDQVHARYKAGVAPVPPWHKQQQSGAKKPANT